MTDPPETPTCPFCGASWTARMLDTFDRHARGIACSCCVVLPGLVADQEPVALPKRDLCCESCGKPIYRAKA